MHHHFKFSPHATQAVFLSYLLEYKEYKLLNLTTNAIFISWDVEFHESIFPFKNILSHTFTYNFFSNRVLSFSISPSREQSSL